MAFENSGFASTLTASELESACRECQRCALGQGRTQAVIGSGPIPAPLMIVGEAPGHDEDIQGRPFVGRSGQLLTQILASVGIDRSTVYITNVVKCRPPQNRTPLADEIATCQSYLIRQFQLVQPKILIVLGTPSMRAILGTQSPISKVRGQWTPLNVPYQSDPLMAMTMFHPSYLLRNPSRTEGSPKWLTWQDIQSVHRQLMSNQTKGASGFGDASRYQQ